MLIVLLSLLVLCACSPQKDDLHWSPPADSAAVSIPQKVPTVAVDKGWTPEGISLKCRVSGGCPAAVGLLFIAVPNDDKTMRLARCTASMIASDEIITAGHCDLADGAKFIFITQDGVLAQTAHHISKLLLRQFTANAKDLKATSGEPDVAIFQLEDKLTGITPLTAAQGSAAPFAAISNLTAYVVNDDGGNGQFAIDRLDCALRRNELYFPYDLSENPNMITASDCEAIEGNSGAAMLDAQGLVEAVVDGGHSGADMAQEVRTDLKREPLAFEIHDVTLATNVRCLQLGAAPAPACTKVTEADRKKRFGQLVNGELVKQLGRRQIENADGYDVQFRDIAGGLKNSSNSPASDFEVLYYPKCRTTPGVLTTVPFPTEHVKMDFDPWGEPKFTGLGMQVSAGNVQARQGDTYSVIVSWAPSIGTYEHPELDPRSQMAGAFSIALPQCPR